MLRTLLPALMQRARARWEGESNFSQPAVFDGFRVVSVVSVSLPYAPLKGLRLTHRSSATGGLWRRLPPSIPLSLLLTAGWNLCGRLLNYIPNTVKFSYSLAVLSWNQSTDD